MPHIWEHRHSYYCEMQNYRARPDEGCTQEFDCWAEFIAEWGDSDEDMNLLFRWDWMPATDEDGDDIKPMTGDGGELRLCFMMQRKGDYRCVVVHGMKNSDEQAVIAYLQPLAEHMRNLWSPLLTAAP